MKKKMYLSVLAVSMLVGVSPVYGAKAKKVSFWNKRDQAKEKHTEHMASIQWYTDYKEAEAAAQKDKKPMLLFFTGSDWCGWCKKMEKEIFSSKDFQETVGHQFIFVEVDFPMKKNLPPTLTTQNTELKKKYDIKGFPTIVVVDPSGAKLLETGYRPGGGKAFAQYLESQMPGQSYHDSQQEKHPWYQ